jgi:hypothetical protein
MADPLDLDLRLGHMRRSSLAARPTLPRPLRELSPTGPILPPAAVGSQAAVVGWKHTRAQVQYMTQGKGYGGEDATLFGPQGTITDPGAFIAAAQADPKAWGQFRLMVSLKEHHAYLAMRPLIESLMAQMSRDLMAPGQGPRPLDWLAAIHHDTDRPHAHIALRGRDLAGERLAIKTHYLNHGIRARVQYLATLLLGPVMAQPPAQRPETPHIAQRPETPRMRMGG